MQKDAPTVMFIPTPPAAHVCPSNATRHDYWSSEKECHKWLLDILYSTPEMEVFDEPRLVDIYGNKARADIGVVLQHNGTSLFFVVELKHQVTLSTNASSAYIQAYHYREMCVVDDDRLPRWVNGASPTYAFSGVFVSDGKDQKLDHQDHRCAGMGFLAANMKVGNVWYNPRSDQIQFRSGDMRIFSIPLDGQSPINWQTTADAYLFGKERRNGGRRDRQTVAEKFFEMQQTFKELF